MTRIIDLTKPIKYYPHDPPYMRVKIDHKSCEDNLLLIEELGLPLDMLPEGFVSIADDTITMGVHSVTHVDSPWHYGPLSEGKKAPAIDETTGLVLWGWCCY